MSASSAQEPVMAPSVALVHDYLLVMRGAERTFAAIADCWPDAPIYTLLYDRRGTYGRFERRSVTTSYLQRLHVRQRSFRGLLPLFPRAVEHLPVQAHDLVVSSSSAFAHGVRPPAGTAHVCYCYTPFRYVWHEYERALSEFPQPLRPVGRRMLARIRCWDRERADDVTHYVAISKLSQARIAASYGREATVVHPPVEIDRFHAADVEDYFLIVSELVRHKNVDWALEAAARSGRRTKVVGDGPERRRLAARFGGGADFLGRAGDAELVELYAHARALIVPSVEEFGIVAVEAHAAGRPVLAVDAGGVQEIVISGETGVLVPPGDGAALAEALSEVDWESFSAERIRARARHFSRDAFQRRFKREVARLTGVGAGGAPEAPMPASSSSAPPDLRASRPGECEGGPSPPPVDERPAA